MYNIKNNETFNEKNLTCETQKIHQNNDDELVEVVVVKYFENARQTYTFLSNGIQCYPGDRVLVFTNGLEQSVIVVTGNKKVNIKNFNFSLKKIIKKL